MAKQKQKVFTKQTMRSQGDNWLIEYKPDSERFYAMVEELATFGLTDREIFQVFLDIDYRRGAELKAGNIDLYNALEKGRANSVAHVTKALFTKACGYSTVETTETVTTNEETGKSTHTIQTKTKQIAPDTAAIMFYLSNKAGDNWKQASKISIVRGADDLDLSSLDEQALKAYIEQMKAKLIAKKDVEPEPEIDEQG